MSSEPITPTDVQVPANAPSAGRDFVPPRCPYDDCPAHEPPRDGDPPFAFVRRGSFVRQGDGRRVQRFRCRTCTRSFSSQSFRLDYRLQRLDTLAPIYAALCSKTTLRKTARNLRVGRSHVVRRLVRLAEHGRSHHEHRLAEAVKRGGCGADFQFDELETFETHRKLKPVTACVLIEEATGFLVSIEVGALAPRGNRTPDEERKLAEYEEREGPRRCESWDVVQKTAAAIARVARRDELVEVTTDCKTSYAKALAKSLGERLVHKVVSSRAPRGTGSRLFPVNHTLARLRDLVSRLVRQTWAVSKMRAWLALHLDVLIAFRNYVDGWRSEPAARTRTSAARQVGAASRKFTVEEFLTWSDPLCLEH